MRRLAGLAGSLVLLAALSTPAHAQQAQVSGKVLDGSGAPVVGAQVEVTNPDAGGLVYKGTTDKKGAFTIAGVLATEQHPGWNVTVKADGYVPVKASYVARTADKVRYADDDQKLGKSGTMPV